MAGHLDHEVEVLPQRLAVESAWGRGETDDDRLGVVRQDPPVALSRRAVRFVDPNDVRLWTVSAHQTRHAGELHRAGRVRALVVRADESRGDTALVECAPELIQQLLSMRDDEHAFSSGE